MEAFKKIIWEAIKKILSLFTSTVEEKIDKQLEEWKGGGLKGIGDKPTDWKFGSSKTWAYIALMNSKQINRQVKWEYNQWSEWETRNWCTIFSAVTELSYLMNRKFTLCEIKEIGHKMIADGKLDPDNWAYLSDAIDYVRRWWNEKFPDRKVESYKIDYTDLKIRKLLKTSKLKMTQLWYRTSKELYDDVQDDWVASKWNYPKVGGHAVSKWWVWIIDNYKGKHKRNRYNFDKFDELLKNWVIFPTWYVFLKAK